MARTKANQKIATQQIRKITAPTIITRKTTIKPASEPVAKKAHRWRQYTQRRRDAIRMQNETKSSFIQYADGFAVVKKLIGEVECELSANRMGIKAHQTTESFKLGALDLLQHIIVDIARIARQFQLHRHVTNSTNTKSAVKLLVADVAAVGYLGCVVETPYPPSIFRDLDISSEKFI